MLLLFRGTGRSLRGYVSWLFSAEVKCTVPSLNVRRYMMPMVR